MNDIILWIVRYLCAIGGGGLITKGLIDQASLEQAIGAIAVLVGIGISILVKVLDARKNQ